MNLFRRGPQFSIRNIPFSHYGSWFNFSPVLAEGTVSDDIHLVSHQNGRHPVLRLTPGQADAPALAAVTATPALLAWTGRDGTIELAYATADTVRVRGH